MSEFDLNSPFLSLTFDSVPKHWKLVTAVWMVFWLSVTAGLIYAYAVVLPAYVGFRTALLVGVGVVAVAAGGSS